MDWNAIIKGSNENLNCSSEGQNAWGWPEIFLKTLNLYNKRRRVSKIMVIIVAKRWDDLWVKKDLAKIPSIL